MIREFRYYVFKVNDVKKYLNHDEQHMLNELGIKLTAGRIKEGKQPYNGVVVDQDWPEFEAVWAMLESRVDGTQLPISPRMERIMELDYAMMENVKNERSATGQDMTNLDIFKWFVRKMLRQYPRSLLSSSASAEEKAHEKYTEVENDDAV